MAKPTKSRGEKPPASRRPADAPPAAGSAATVTSYPSTATSGLPAERCNPTRPVLRLGVGRLDFKEEMNVMVRRGNSNRYQVRLLAVALLAVLGFVAAGCGGGSSSSSAPKKGVAGAQHSTGSVAVKTRKIKGFGTVLVNPAGRTLYVFMKDQHRHVTCTGSCTSFWPPLKWKKSSKPKAGGAAKNSLMGTANNPAGGKV